jgi:hypothetical protein
MKKHQCPSCSCSSSGIGTPDPWWAKGMRFVVYARHIHTGEITAQLAVDERRRAENYISHQKIACSSHDSFVLYEMRKEKT